MGHTMLIALGQPSQPFLGGQMDGTGALLRFQGPVKQGYNTDR